MSCTGCGNNSNVLMPCRVCELIDNDSTPKRVKYCNLCGAYICKDDETNVLRRAKAALIDLKLKLE